LKEENKRKEMEETDDKPKNQSLEKKIEIEKAALDVKKDLLD